MVIERQWKCARCHEMRDRARFHYHRTLGVVCAECICEALGYETIEEYQREQFERGGNPRGA